MNGPRSRMARPAAVIAVIAVVVASAAAAVARVPCPVEFALGADGRRRPVRLAVIGVSKRSNVDVRDAIRRTWCATARALNAETRGAATVKVRWTVARPPGAVAADDDAAEQDVRTVNHVDSPSASVMQTSRGIRALPMTSKSSSKADRRKRGPSASIGLMCEAGASKSG